jgi:hypothetical protein
MYNYRSGFGGQKGIALPDTSHIPHPIALLHRKKRKGGINTEAQSPKTRIKQGLLKKLPASRFDSSQETGVQEAHLLAMQ